MQHTNSPQVGQRIRTLRENKGLSLRGLAQKCGLSINAISRIERGENSPTVSSLHQLATALEVPIVAFFQEDPAQTTVFVKSGNHLLSERSGIKMESLGIGLRNQQLEPFLVTLEPGVRSAEKQITHPGQEFVYVLEGSISYYVNEQIFEMASGDSLLFEANQPHYFENTSTGKSRIILVFQVSRGSHLARQQHLE